MNLFKKIFFRITVSILFSLPVYFLVQQNILKYQLEYKSKDLNQKNSNLSDINKDGITETCFFFNISDEQIYLEMWSEGSLLGVWTAPGQLIYPSVLQDSTSGGSSKFFFVSQNNQDVYINELSLGISDKKLVTSHKSKLLVKNSSGDGIEFLQCKMMDLDRDGENEYVFSLSAALHVRNIVSYNPKTEAVQKSDTDFMMVTDFFMMPGDNNGQVIFTSYANGNVSKKNIKRMVDAYNLDTSLYSNFYSDLFSYTGVLSPALKVKELKLQRPGFTSMYRLAPLKRKKKQIYACLSTFINQPDTLPQISILDDQLNILHSANITLPVQQETFTKYNKEIIYVKENLDDDQVYFIGHNDTVYELTTQLKLLPVVFSTNINDKSKLEFIDLDNDGHKEIILSGTKGLEICQDNFTDKILLESPGVSFLKKNRFSKTIGNRVEWEFLTDTNCHITLTYRLNPLFYWKLPIFAGTATVIFCILSLLLWLNGRKIEKENKRLEELVTERTKEVVAQKAISDHQRELIQEKQKEIIDSITYAKHIQNAILAKEEDILHYFPESFLLYLPKDIVAGDFYFFENSSTHVFYAAADCTGHGVPGALVSMVCSNALTRCVKEFGLYMPGEILDKATELVLETFRKSGQHVKDGMDISLLVKDLRSNEFFWAGANNSLWIIHSSGLSEIKANKQPIGMSENPKSFVTHKLKFEKGDLFYLFTDGFADQFGGEKGKKFKYRQLAETLLEIKTEPAREQKKILEKIFYAWKGNLEQIDDVCIIGINPDL